MKYIYYFVVLLIIVSCSGNKDDNLLAYSLEISMDNSPEIERVLAYYKKNMPKQKAAIFLIQNMITKSYLSGNKVSGFHQFIDSVYQIKQEEYYEKTIYKEYENRQKYRSELFKSNSDLQTLRSDFIIKHIDEAFDVWNRPWNSHLTFEEFCELILPYRIGNEIPENWRTLYKTTFEDLLTDSILTAHEACVAINNKLIKLPIHIFYSTIKPSDIKPSSLIHIKFGLCEDYAALAVFAMRSVGIPVGVEFVPHWGQKNNGHTFNVVYNNDGAYYDFSGGENNPGEHISRFEGIPKIYRKTYGLQEQSLAMRHGSEAIPSFFKNPCIKDVTENYDCIHAQDITIPLSKNRPDKRFAYLTVFDTNGWSSVDWGEITNNKVIFKNVGSDIMYQVACYDKGLIPLSSPFYVDTCGKITILEGIKNTSSLCLERKQKLASHLSRIPPSIVGSKFQGSDFEDFRVAEDLYLFTSTPEPKFTTVSVSPRKSYRYYRYLSSPQTCGNMAEVEFYNVETDSVVHGEVIGTDITSIYYPDATKHTVFDGDALTFFHTRDTLSWAGVKLDKPTMINKIRYIIRNDDNGVRRNNLYELLYIDENKQWTSAGRKIATEDDMIIFDNIPAGTLYWLRNHTRGREERIFTYENGKQIWW